MQLTSTSSSVIGGQTFDQKSSDGTVKNEVTSNKKLINRTTTQANY